MNGNLTAQDSGTCSTGGACLVLNLSSTAASSVIQLSGTWTGTVQFEGAAPVAPFVSLMGTVIGGTTQVTSSTANGAWRANVSGLAAVRVRVSSYGSGTIVATITSSTGSASVPGTGGGGSFTASQDLSGTSSAQTVIGLETIALPTLAASTGCLFDNNGTLQLITGCNLVNSTATYFTSSGGVLQIGGQSTAIGAFNTLAPTVTGQGDLMVGTSALGWTLFGHNQSGTVVLSENGSGVMSWLPSTTFAPGSLNTGDVFVGSAGNAPVDVPMSGDCSIVASGAITCLKTNGVAFAASATTDTTNATNISSGTLNNLRLSTVDAPHGGSGVASPTAHSLLMAEGTSPFNTLNAGLTGQGVQSNNGADFTVVSPGLAGRSVSGTTDTILCDSATALRDRLTTIQYTSGSAVAVTLPQAGSSGCASNFSFGAFITGAGAVTFTTTTSTINQNGQTITPPQNSSCVFSSPDNANWIARCATSIKFGANITPTYNADGSITIAGSAGGGTPCTTTALSFQYNNAGAFGCAADFTLVSSHTLTAGSSGLIDFTAITAANGTKPMQILAGCTAGADGALCYDSTNKNPHIRINGADAIGAGIAAALTANFLPKMTDSTHGLLKNSSCDDGSTTANVFTCTDSAGAQFTEQVQVGSSGPACTAASGNAGAICISEGTAPTNSSGTALIYPDSTAHEFFAKTNGASSAGMIERTQPSPIHQTGKTASISTATLCAASAGACNIAGQYHVHFDFIETGTACSNVTAGSVSFQLTWTDTNGTAHSAITIGVYDQKAAGFTTAFSFNTALGTAGASGDFNISTNGSVIQYATTYTACTTGTGTYQLDAAVSRIQ